MSVTLKINDEEDYATNHPVITFGRRADNNVSLNDPNVSQYHARIEQREDGYWLIDQGSSNGTSLNGNVVDPEMLLEDGDAILLGGTSRIVFNLDDAKKDETITDTEAVGTDSAASETKEEKSGKSSLMLVAGGLVGVAVITVVVAGAVIWGGSGKKCEATASIKGPENGDVLTQTTEVSADVHQKTQCVGKVIFLLDGKEVGNSEVAPYKISLDSQNFSDLSDGLDHRLKLVLLDAKNEPIPQAGDEIALAFETLADPEPITEVTPNTQPGPGKTIQPTGPQVGGIETKEMIEKFLKTNFPNAPSYKLDTEFISQVNKKTAEYISEGYFIRAQQYKDIINTEYVQEKNLDPSLGYILAMSRSRFNLEKQAANEGIWQMSKTFVEESGFIINDNCEQPNLSDTLQKCAAKASSTYLKAIVLGTFNNDIIFGVAASGMTLSQAAEWNGKLPQNPAARMDFWKLLPTKQREEIIRFFAAGVVAENPGKFGLKKDRPISELYRNLLGS